MLHSKSKIANMLAGRQLREKVEPAKLCSLISVAEHRAFCLAQTDYLFDKRPTHAKEFSGELRTAYSAGWYCEFADHGEMKNA